MAESPPSTTPLVTNDGAMQVDDQPSGSSSIQFPPSSEVEAAQSSSETPTSSAPIEPAPTSSTEPSEIELLKAGQLRKEVEHEQAVADALARVAELEEILEKERDARQVSKTERDGLGTRPFYNFI